ncbi:MAG: META domain-containing protein [Brevibacterium sp.]
MTHSVIGKWISTKESSSAFLHFREDDTLTGSDGGNRISSTWSIDDTGAVIKPFVTTQRAVMGMDAWLGRVHRVEADGGQLNVFDVSGNNLGVLIRDEAAESPDSSGGGR